MSTTLSLCMVFMSMVWAVSADRVIDVQDDAGLRRALSDAAPGTRIRIAPGSYSPGIFVQGLRGTTDQPIVIEGADPDRPPVFRGGGTAWQFSDCAYLTVRNLAVRGQSGNGINIDDGGTYDTPSHHFLLESLQVSEIGPKGNRDGIKLSGVVDFVIRDCTIDGWGGQAIDMVGCHRGLIEGCRFLGRAGFSQATGPQTKGGSSQIVIRRCLFLDAGQRGVNLGGSTGMAYFRPADASYEARDITVDSNTIWSSSVQPISRPLSISAPTQIPRPFALPTTFGSARTAHSPAAPNCPPRRHPVSTESILNWKRPLVVDSGRSTRKPKASVRMRCRMQSGNPAVVCFPFFRSFP